MDSVETWLRGDLNAAQAQKNAPSRFQMDNRIFPRHIPGVPFRTFTAAIVQLFLFLIDGLSSVFRDAERSVTEAMTAYPNICKAGKARSVGQSGRQSNAVDGSSSCSPHDVLLLPSEKLLQRSGLRFRPLSDCRGATPR